MASNSPRVCFESGCMMAIRTRKQQADRLHTLDEEVAGDDGVASDGRPDDDVESRPVGDVEDKGNVSSCKKSWATESSAGSFGRALRSSCGRWTRTADGGQC